MRIVDGVSLLHVILAGVEFWRDNGSVNCA